MAAHSTLGFVELEPLAIVGIDLIWVIVGLLAFMILVGFWLIATILNDLFGGFSIFGFHPFGFAKGLMNSVMKKEAAFLDSKARGLGHFLWATIMIIWRFIYVATATMAGLWNQYILGQKAQDANVGNESNRAKAQENQLAQQEQHDIANLQTEIGGIYSLLQGEITQNALTLEAQLQQLQRQLAGLGPGTDVALKAELEQDVASLQAQINQMQATFSGQLAGETTTLTNQLAQLRTVLEQEIANGVQTSENYATGLVSGLSLGSITQTLQALQSRLAKVETETAQCLDPLCETVTPQAKRLGNLGHQLGNLELLGIEALMIALAAECLHDPATVAHDIGTVTRSVGDVVMTGFRDLIGA